MIARKMPCTGLWPDSRILRVMLTIFLLFATFLQYRRQNGGSIIFRRNKIVTYGRSGAQNASTTVVIAAALNYGLVEFRNFIVPLRKFYAGDVVLFVNDNLPRAVLDLCINSNIATIPLPSGSRLGVKGNRYIGYSKVCSQYDLCLATDFRDVFFQANPFSSVPKADLIFFEEVKRVKMGYKNGRPTCTPSVSDVCTCPYNANWIKTCWGENFLSSIANETPICSGTIIGTPAGFLDLEKKMLSEMSRTSTKKGCSARDQGHLNYLYFSKRFDTKVLLQAQGKGIINTVGYITPRTDIPKYLNSRGFVVNADNSVPALIHQYDRFPELVALVQTLSNS